MLSSYVPILVITGFALIFAVVMVRLTVFFGPRNPNKEKESTYESGMEPIQTARERFSVKYYMVAVSFIVFDIEIVFLYPWAVSFLSLPRPEMLYSLSIAMIFIVILIAGLVYEYRKGVLKWD